MAYLLLYTLAVSGRKGERSRTCPSSTSKPWTPASGSGSLPTTILRGCFSPRRPRDYPPACQSRTATHCAPASPTAVLRTAPGKPPTTILRGCFSPRRPSDYPQGCQSRTATHCAPASPTAVLRTAPGKPPTTMLRGCFSPRRPSDYPPACQSRTRHLACALPTGPVHSGRKASPERSLCA